MTLLPLIPLTLYLFTNKYIMCRLKEVIVDQIKIISTNKSHLNHFMHTRYYKLSISVRAGIALE